jgi:type III secretion protein V
MFLIAITLMLLMPLPTVMLDFLLVINLSFAVVLLLAGLYMPNTLAMLSFPSLLLLTTLFRLSLNVASTRLILSQGDAGRVIDAFGRFLIHGEVVVGIIIFLIITVVNFIVIARGSTRVSEVAARFALDALPGKQLAIDSDLRAGLISAQDAQHRRDELRKESQLYGSMDGAMKFVQGDAIAGLFIIVTNILGGMYVGIRSGMSFEEAIQTYTVLTVGDGLVNQIPAILISICAGLVVTRVSSGEDASLGSDVQAQVFARPGTLLFAGGLMVLAACLPGLPFLPFAGVGAVLMGTGWYQRRIKDSANKLPVISAGRTLGALPLGLPGDMDTGRGSARLLVDPLQLYGIYLESREFFSRWWEEVQADYFENTGVQLPTTEVSPDESLGAGAYAIWVSGAIVDRGKVLSEAVLAEMSPASAAIAGLEVLEEDSHPLTGSRVFWTLDGPATRRICQSGGVELYDPIQYAALRLLAFFRHAPEELISVADVLQLEQSLEKRHPGLITQALNREFISTPRLTEVLEELLRQGVNVRDFRRLVELLSSYCSNHGITLVSEGEFDLQDIVSFIRSARRRHILAGLLSSRRSLRVITLSPEIETLFEEAPVSSAIAGPVFPPDNFESVQKGLEKVADQVFARGVLPIALLCRGELRSRVLSFMHYARIPIGILSFDELESGIVVEPVGVWRA